MEKHEQNTAPNLVTSENNISSTRQISTYSQSMLSQQPGFVGREYELAAIEQHFKDPNCRLLTLTGLGGIGKTRIACEAAARISHVFTHGSYFVPLAPILSPNLVAPTLASSIGLFLQGDQPLRTQLISYLSERELLLVLDNFEHLMSDIDLIIEILQAAPHVRMLVTSRERLNLREEWVIDIYGMRYPQTETDSSIEKYSAIQFFIECARRVKADFELTEANKASVLRICRLVEGVPLGIELAASWVRVLSCQAIGDEIERNLDFLTSSLRNVPEKHGSMRAVFEKSYRLLTLEQQQVFRKLSVFRGGFRREAAEAVADASLMTLASLMDKSLLRTDAEDLYTIHELLRQYGDEQLSISAVEMEQTRDRHCDYYANFLKQSWLRLTGKQIKIALTDIEIELDNIRAAWDRASHRHQVAQIEALLNSLWFFYDERGRYQEGEQTFAKAAATFSDNSTDYVKICAKIQARQGALCHLAGLSDKGNRLLRESIVRLRHDKASADLAFALHRLAIFVLDNDLAFTEADTYLQESLSLFTELHDRWGMGHVLNWLSILYHKKSAEQGVENALEQARHYAQECLKVFQELDSPRGIATAYLNFGDVAYLSQEYKLCWQYADKSLTLFKEIGVFWGISISLCLMGQAARALRAYDNARRYVVHGLLADFEYRLTSANYYSLHHLALAAQIWLDEGQTEPAYELLAMIDQQLLTFRLSRRQHGAFVALDRLNGTLPSHLIAAVERGKTRDINTAIKEIIADFSDSAEHGKESSRLTIHKLLIEVLSERELEVLRLVAEGHSNQEIADRLVIGVSTVKKHINHIYDKLDAKNRTQAVALARERQILT